MTKNNGKNLRFRDFIFSKCSVKVRGHKGEKCFFLTEYIYINFNENVEMSVNQARNDQIWSIFAKNGHFYFFPKKRRNRHFVSAPGAIVRAKISKFQWRFTKNKPLDKKRKKTIVLKKCSKKLMLMLG